jgi:hypothetical protein
VGRRSEQRIALRVPIVVRGKDSRGSPFTITAQTHDITATGASLNGLKGIADVGSKIEIEYQGRKAMYRVQWIGKVGTPRSGHAALSPEITFGAFRSENGRPIRSILTRCSRPRRLLFLQSNI